MTFKKATYTLVIEAIKQIDFLSKKTGKTKSEIIADLIMNAETSHDKIVNMAVNLESTEKVTLKEMEGVIKNGKKFDPVKMKI
jgi:predicted DNA-binding protein